MLMTVIPINYLINRRCSLSTPHLHNGLLMVTHWLDDDNSLKLLISKKNSFYSVKMNNYRIELSVLTINIGNKDNLSLYVHLLIVFMNGKSNLLRKYRNT